MKKVLTFTLLTVVVFAISNFSIGCKPEMKPTVYNDSVLYYYTALDKQVANLYQSIYDSKVTASELKDEFDFTIKMYNDNLPKINKIKSLKDDEWFHKSVVDFYETVKKSLDNEFKQIIDFYSEEWNDSYGPKIDKLSKKILEDITKKEDNVIQSQKKFAEKYQITLI